MVDGGLGAGGKASVAARLVSRKCVCVCVRARLHPRTRSTRSNGRTDEQTDGDGRGVEIRINGQVDK